MGKRHSFRPAACEALEERVVLSHSPAASVRAAAVQAASHHGPNPNWPVPFVGPVGTLGDSYTDEYRFYPPNRAVARNWVEILHSLRGVSFGPFTTKSRGEPRNQGFAYNWARSDATSVDMVNNQLPGLAAQVAAGKVRYAWVFIGGNDYLHLLNDAVAGTIPPADLPAAVVATTARLEADFLTAVNTLLAANPNVRLVVSTLPAISDVPLARIAATISPQANALLQGIDQAVVQYNDVIKAVANGNSRVALADLAAVTQQAASSPTGTITFGGQTINLLVPSDDYHSFFLGDLIHVGTVGQGIIADTFALAIDQEFGSQLFPPSPQEIVSFAAAVQRHATHVVARRPRG